MTETELPPIGVVVKALCRPHGGWAKALGKDHRPCEKEFLLRRIPTKDTAKGWQWSDADIKTYFAWEVISWQYISPLK